MIGNGATGGTLALTMNGAGTLALNGANTFSGLLRINSGIVATNNLTTVGAAQGIGEASTLALNGGTFEYNGGTGTYEQNNANAGSTLAISAGPNGGALWNNSAANYFAYDGVLSGAGNLTFLSSTTATNAANNSQWFIEASKPRFHRQFRRRQRHDRREHPVPLQCGHRLRNRHDRHQQPRSSRSRRRRDHADRRRQQHHPERRHPIEPIR